MFPSALNLLNQQERHDYVLKTYIFNKNKHKRDVDVIKEHHKFLWDEEITDDSCTWETKFARSYYDKLFKEYCIADLTRYKENKVALRWRTEAEVISGEGQFQCGSRKCEEREELRSWEVNFAYQEHGERKNALVKLRLCPTHSAQLNYSSRKREIRRMHKRSKESKHELRKKKRIKHEFNQEESINSVDNDGEKEQIDAENEEISITQNEENPAGEFTDAENVWRKRPELEVEQQTRESEFERYLEDLLL